MAKKKSDDFFNKGMDALIKQFGSGFGHHGLAEVSYKAIPTGHDDLDCLLTKGSHGMYQGGIIELFGSEGSGKCITRDTRCLTRSGLLSVEEIFEECKLKCDAVIGFVKQKFDLLNGLGKFETTSHFYYNGYGPTNHHTKRIVTKDGFVLEGTFNHPVKVMSKTGYIVWKRLDQIQLGDAVCMCRGTKIWNDKSNLSIDEASLVGYLIGDENAPTHRIGFSNIDNYIVRDFKKCLSSSYGHELLSCLKEYGGDFYIHNKVFVDQFRRKHDIGNEKSSNKKIPKTIRSAGRNAQSAFIRAYFDIDGTYQKNKQNLQFSSVSLELLRDLQLMLLNFGIYSYLTLNNKQCNSDYYTLEIACVELDLYAELIGFNDNKKSNAVIESLEVNKTRNTNINTIPYQREKIRSLYSMIDPNQKNKDTWRVFNDIVQDECNITYNHLDKILDIVNNLDLGLVKDLQDLRQSKYIFSGVVKIESSIARTYDFTLPETHSFWSNGFVSHNTSLALRTVGNAQKMGYRCCWLDAESAFDETLAKLNGCDPTQLILPDLAETSVVKKARSTDDQIQFFNVYEILEMIYRSVISNLFALVVLDSVAGLMPERILQDRFDPNKSAAPAEVARALSDMLRKIAPACKKRETSVIFINQKRDQPGTIYHNPNHTPGGRALKFFAHQRIRIEKKGGVEGQVWADIDGKRELIGHYARAKIVKNKKAPPVPPGVEIEIPIYYREYFPDNAEKCYRLARDLQVITIHKGTLTWKDQDSIVLQVTGESGMLLKIREKRLESKLAADCVKSEFCDRNQKKKNPTKVPTSIMELAATYNNELISASEKFLKKIPAIDV